MAIIVPVRGFTPKMGRDCFLAENAAVIGHIYAVIAKIAKEQGFADGYRVVTNVGELAGQTVHHIHFHVLSGKQLGSFN